VSFLHVYHHASMCVLWWMVCKWIPGERGGVSKKAMYVLRCCAIRSVGWERGSDRKFIVKGEGMYLLS